MPEVDYYAILGVLPNAEDVVIRAAYKALAQRYHPDKFTGSAAEASLRMQEINAAYSVLGDPLKRANYDDKRCADIGDSSSYFDEGADSQEPDYDPLEEQWSVVVSYFPELIKINGRLQDIAWRLAYSFRAALLENKKFENAEAIENVIENKFLQSYFGTNQEILTFAKDLIAAKNRRAALALNRAIMVIGSFNDANRIIQKIKKDHCTPEFKTRTELQEKEKNADYFILIVIATFFAICLLVLGVALNH